MIAGIGTDLVQIKRIAAALERSGPRFAERILAPEERAEYAAAARPAVFLAKRFAVKEAASKALGTGIAKGVSWHHIQLRHAASGAPLLHLCGRAAELQQVQQIDALHVSLSDEQDHVIAFVVLERRSEHQE
ncbi:holo-ACP synthase [Motiliproteus sediminis]|uniref:holo-ACP synthase n=1 Tax=Motiliproteus sediminis TaxID=1468178 RepID=UPI001AEF3DC3